jgi:hypothetical protein
MTGGQDRGLKRRIIARCWKEGIANKMGVMGFICSLLSREQINIKKRTKGKGRRGGDSRRLNLNDQVRV